MERQGFRAMGCRMLAVLDPAVPDAAAELARVPEWFEEWEQCLSRFRADSELSELNRSGGRPVPVSDTLWAVLGAAQEAARESNGRVVPTLLDALEAAGYDRDFDAVRATSSPAPAARRAAPDGGAWRAIRFDVQSHSVSLPPGVRLDLGGIAKGWAADRAARRLAELGAALVDAGGDVAVSGVPDGRPGWPIGVGDPLHPDEQIELLCLARGGVATSGRDYRRWQQDGIWQHHILDPHTGRPADTDVLSATVVAPSARQAEMAAKVVLILGSRAGLQWLDARAEMAGLVVLDNGHVMRSRRFDEYRWNA